jgi:hypothetical protein
MDAFDIGFTMGLIVGEGSFTGDRRAPVLSVKLHQRDPEPLQILQRSLGGKVYGPYHHDGRHFFLYHLRGAPLRSAVPLLLAYLPESHKRRQFLLWIAKYGLTSQPRGRRGVSPAFPQGPGSS